VDLQPSSTTLDTPRDMPMVPGLARNRRQMQTSSDQTGRREGRESFTILGLFHEADLQDGVICLVFWEAFFHEADLQDGFMCLVFFENLAGE
jgi:hypothetical protein